MVVSRPFPLRCPLPHITPLYIAHSHTTSILRRPDSSSVCLGWNCCCSHSPLSVLMPRGLQVHLLCCCTIGTSLVPARPPPQIGLTRRRSVLLGAICCPSLPLFVSLAPGLQAFAPCCLTALLLRHRCFTCSAWPLNQLGLTHCRSVLVGFVVAPCYPFSLPIALVMPQGLSYVLHVYLYLYSATYISCLAYVYHQTALPLIPDISAISILSCFRFTGTSWLTCYLGHTFMLALPL